MPEHSEESTAGHSFAETPDGGMADEPLSSAQQTRNIIIFSINVALIYLASPVVYVGMLQASLCNELGANDTFANMPASANLCGTVLPIVAAWFFPAVRQLKPVLITSYSITALTTAMVVAVLLVPLPDWLAPMYVVVPALVIHAFIVGFTQGVVSVNQWEVIGRGVSSRRRGQALGMAYGFGPILAVVASIGSQLLLSGKFPGFIIPEATFLGLAIPRMQVPDLVVTSLPYPWNFASIFLATVPTMLLAALLSSLFVVPLPEKEAAREPFTVAVFGGFLDFLSNRMILIAATAYILAYSGHMVLNNMNLYTEIAMGESPKDYVGLQLALRFGFKIVAGFFLGWLLFRTNPKVLLLTTASLTLCSVMWAMGVTGHWFLIGFGILGMGELFGLYYPNYILDCTPKIHIRRNMAFASVITMPVAFAPALYGGISDIFGQHDRGFGLRMSFIAAIVVLLTTITLVLVALPWRPKPQQEH